MPQQESLSSVYNAIRILREFTNEEPELGITELSRRLGLAKSTVFRLIRTLNDDNLVEQNEKTQKYHLGITAFELGFAAYHGNELRMIAYPLLNKLLKVLREPVHLGVYDRGEILFLCKRIPESHNGTISRLGKRAPSYCIASGKVLLASQKQEEIERVLTNGLKAYTTKTITEPGKLREQLQEIRRMGYAVAFSEYNEGYSSVAVPVYNDVGGVSAAISVALSTSFLYPNQVQNYVNEMKMYSRLITERLDYN
jgi:IclR family KDG regulon transcriptional repressor